jgi:thiamine biosynthesis lipoprotein
MTAGYARRQAVEVMGTVFSFCLVAPADLAARAVSAAVAELRAVDAAFSPYRTDSMVSRVRRGELTPSAYPPHLIDVVDRCTEMNVATGGWFDAWGLPGGFDPSGLVKGWGTESAAACIQAAGVDDFAISAGGDVVVRGCAPHGGPWRVGIRDPHDPAAVVLVLELTDAAVATSASYERTVVGPDLATADAYATALYAAGMPGLTWFNATSEYRAITLDDRLVATFSDGVPHGWLPRDDAPGGYGSATGRSGQRSALSWPLPP